MAIPGTPGTPLALAVGLVGLVVLAGCAPPSLRAEAQTLVETVPSSPGVQSATLDYTEPMALDSGKLRLRVTMTPEAGADEAADVVATVYQAYATTHADEEGDLEVRLGDDRIHLRTFEPLADRAVVRAQTAAVLEQAPRGRLAVSVLADDVPADPGVRTSTTLRLPPGSTGEEVLATFDDLEARYADEVDLGWAVRAADGAGLAGDGAFPSDLTRQRWERLSNFTVPGASLAVHYDTYVSGTGGVFPSVAVTVVGIHAPLSLDDPATYRRLMRLATRQVETMQSYSSGIAYRLVLEGRNVASVEDQLGAYGRGTGQRFAQQLALTTGIET